MNFIYDFYSETIFAVVIVRILTSIFLFIRRHEGDRSRIILSVITFFSVLNYIPRYWDTIHGQAPVQVVSVPILLLGLFMITSYIIYPIEVVSPGWLNFKRVILLYLPVLILCGVWLITLRAGVVYPPYDSLHDMLPYIRELNVLFRFILCFLMLCTVFFIFFVPYTRKYCNADSQWKWTYSILCSINTITLLWVLWEKNSFASISYYYISVGCNLVMAYMELFNRVIRLSKTNLPEIPEKTFKEVLCQFEPNVLASFCDEAQKSSTLFNNMDEYMKKNEAWRDPDLTLSKLSSIMNTNRTTLSLAIQKSEYENYPTYINKLRIDDFVYCVNSNYSGNYQEAFYDAGFRSRTTALRNFRQVTGMTPTEYFLEKQK